MMASSLDLSECAELAPLAELVASLRVAAPEREPLLVGAMARDVLLWYAHGIALARATEDTDFAVAVADWDDFSTLRGALVAGGEFSAVPNVHHRLLYRGERRLDLLPFGGVERADRSIAWPPGQDTVMQVLGYSEAFAMAIPVRLPAASSVMVVSLPALALLKLFAWHDRRLTQPGKDATDLWLILSTYLDAGNRDRVYAEATHLLEADDYDERRAGAWMLGRDIRTWLSGAPQGDAMPLTHALQLLEQEVDVEGTARLARDMRRHAAEDALEMLVAMHAGMAGLDQS
jgi:predicted nucleotidyltransferase